MAMLSRYQRAGGFLQLLQLIETCGKQKQDSFLNMIEAEDPKWAKAVREKMLTMEVILGWSDDTVAEVAARLPQLTLATAMHGLKPEDHERLLKTFAHAQKRNIEDLFKAKAPNAAEITAAFLKILQEARSMIMNGMLRIDKFAPNLIIPENYEEMIGKSSPAQPGDSRTSANAATATSAGSKTTAVSQTKAVDKDDKSIREKLQLLLQENAQLKAENQLLRSQLQQLKKAA